MRTRFLTDFFNTSATSHSIQTIDFLRFPPPDLNSPNCFTFDQISFFDQITSFNISHETVSFSGNNEALSKFFSEVLPQRIEVEVDQLVAAEVSSEDKINENSDGAANTKVTALTFKTPEIHISTEDSCFLREEKIQIFFEVKDAEASSDLLDFSLGVDNLMDVHKSIFLVEDLSLELQEENKSDLFEDSSLVKGQTSSTLGTFPVLEVDETSMGINSHISENKHMIFESNEIQQWFQKDESTYDVKELLISMKFDILEHLLNCPPVTCHKFEVPYVNFGHEEEIINAIEHPTTDGYFSLTFEQFQSFDINKSHFSEVFSKTEIITEVEHCEQMFSETTFSTFNSLIVTHELILRDDSFISLPVPIISDHEKIQSVQVIVKEIFLKLKLQPSSTSDGIYLDWHLLEDSSSKSICNSLKMFEDIDTYCIDGDMNSCDRQWVITDFVLSDGDVNEQKTEEKTKVLNIEISGSLIDPVCHDRIASRRFNDLRQKMTSREALLDNKAKRAHQHVESMSQFDDLNFFLNPLEATSVKKQKPSDKKNGMDIALPVTSENIPTKTHDSSQKQQLSLENERGDFHSSSILTESSKNSGPLHSTNVERKNSMKSLDATYEVPQLSFNTGANKFNTYTPSIPDAIVIMNNDYVDTEMVISRRSTYQKILAMEKEGVQVVERDLNLPVDVIVSVAVCLVLYDSKNIRKKTSTSESTSSLLSSCVENIAANVLTSLSFSFSSCILIFEGEVGFLAGIMESLDELYAAAASLGMNLQLFCSYSSETTDEIILNSIARAAKSTRGIYPKMPESETLAESFLSKIPSLNPLSAHAILSSVGTLIEFLEMSHQQRVCAVQKYLVPDASITLFSALCRYVQREDSRSGMTDCSSSVSSGPNSGNCCPKSDHDQKKRKYIGSPETKAIPMDHSFQFQQNNDAPWNPPKTDNSPRFWNLEADEVSDAILKSNSSFDEIYFGENQRSNPCNVSNSKVPEVMVTNTSFGQKKKMHIPMVDKFGSHSSNNSKGLHGGFKGEVIEIDDDDDVACEDFSFVHSERFSPMTEKGCSPGFQGAAKQFSTGWCSLPNFPTAAEISSDFDSWIPTKNNGQSFSEEITLNSHTDLRNKNSTPIEQHQMSSEECSIVNSPVNFSRVPFKEMDPSYGRTPLSKAIFSAQLEKGSPWTIDFLNRVKEKSRMRQHSLPNISSAPCFGFAGNSSKFRKRKSPSILDFYRYQRGSTAESIENKGKKVSVQPSSSSKAVKTSPFSSQTWTPADKRSKRKLTFATNGSKGQSKLIWSDKSDQVIKGRL